MPFFRRHRSLQSVVHSAAFACFSMGFNSGIIAGALLYLEEHYADIKEDAVMKGMVTSIVFASAFLANLCVASLADRLGRTLILYLINVPFVLGALVSAFAPDAQLIIAGRAITGFAVGIAGTLPNLYIAEIVPPESRGRCVGMAPLYGTTGIMASQFASWITAEALGHSRCAEIGWRIMFGMGALPPIMQLLWALGLPESPRWCRQQGYHERAERNLEYLSELGVDISDGMPTTPHMSLAGTPQAEPEKLGMSRGAIAVGLSVMQQLSGVNAVIYYAPHLYTQLGVVAHLAILIAGLNSVAQVMMTRIMTLVIDSWGRRKICLLGLIGMLIGLVTLGSVFQHFLNLGVVFAIGGILVFRLSFSLSLGPLPYIMVTELFPQKHRARGVATSMATNWLLNWVVVFAVPVLMKRPGAQGMVFFAFAVVALISIVIVDLWLPETSGQDLEDASGAPQHRGVIRTVLGKCGLCKPQKREPSLLEPHVSDPFGLALPAEPKIKKVESQGSTECDNAQEEISEESTEDSKCGSPESTLAASLSTRD